MIRRAGISHSGSYEHIPVPMLQDDNETLHSKWVRWTELEGFKRLAHQC